jgi:hypothetical protein
MKTIAGNYAHLTLAEYLNGLSHSMGFEKILSANVLSANVREPCWTCTGNQAKERHRH